MLLLAVIGALFLVVVLLLAILYAAFLIVAPWLPAYRAKTLDWPRKLVLLAALLYDVILNWALLSVLLWDRPRESTVTLRMGRYLWQGTGWRFHLARAVCEELDKHDPGHCRCGAST